MCKARYLFYFATPNYFCYCISTAIDHSMAPTSPGNGVKVDSVAEDHPDKIPFKSKLWTYTCCVV